MRCCPECFKDPIGKDLISTLATESSDACDVCRTSCGKLLEVKPESELSGQFYDLLGVFSVSSNDDNQFASLFDAFKNTWNVFKDDIKEESFNSLIRSMFPNDERIADLLSNKVKVDPSPDPKNPYKLAFFGKEDWHAFSNEIMHNHRYHAQISNREVLDRLLNALSMDIEPGEESWYRARLWNGKKDMPKLEELREPGSDIAGEGRMSPRGVSCLYISDNLNGAISEIRASRHDEVAILEMTPKEKLRILDLTRIDEISPFYENVDCHELVSNLENLKQIKEALIKPMRSTDNIIEYVPTQYIADLAKSNGFDGIGYYSVLYEHNGKASYNIASFRKFEDAFGMLSIRIYQVKNANLEIQEISHDMK